MAAEFPVAGGRDLEALRNEIPWVAQAPSEYVRKHVFLTLQPVDAPLSTGVLPALLAQDEFEQMLLFSTDYPHWHSRK